MYSSAEPLEINLTSIHLSNFRFIRPHLSLDAAKVYIPAMKLSHITYCLTTWSQAKITTLKPSELLHKRAIKILDKKTTQYHHCPISWNNMIKYANFSKLSVVYFHLHLNCLLTFEPQRARLPEGQPEGTA